MKYKWKDKVRIKSKKELECISEVTNVMLKNGGTVMTIACLVEDADAYLMKEDGDFHFLWTDEMIEGLVEGINDCEKCGLVRNSVRCLFMDYCPHNKQKNIIEIPNGCIKDDNGNVINTTKFFLEKKKKEYPKTYGGCCDTLYRNSRHDECYEACLQGYPMQTFARLLICRDAYWKIAGEEMGLDGPWKPDYKKERYVISRYTDEIVKGYRQAGLIEHFILEFPTEEMRDAFYENFKEEIESVKELL